MIEEMKFVYFEYQGEVQLLLWEPEKSNSKRLSKLRHSKVHFGSPR